MGLVSCVITTYNGASYLREALRSVANQELRPAEVIVVDDGSTTRSAEEISLRAGEEYGLKVRYVYKKNGGAGSARNFGLKMAQHQYVTFLDDDDMFEPEKLLIQVALLDDLSEDYVCVLGSAASYGNEKARLRTERVAVLDGFPNLDLFLQGNLNLGGTAGFLFRRNALLDSGGYDESLRNYEDYELLIRLTREKKIKTHADVVFIRRVRDESLSRSNPTLNLEHTLRFIDKLENSYSVTPSAVARARQRAYFNAARKFLSRRSFRAFKWAYREGSVFGNQRRSWRRLAAAVLVNCLPVSAKRPDV